MEERGAVDFFVSYAVPDQPWAEWVAWQLEDASYSVRLQAWDFRPGSNFVISMHEASRNAKKTLCILSPAFLGSSFAASEWAAAFREDPRGDLGSLLPVRVRQCKPKGLLGSIVYVDLVGAGEDEARHLLLAGVDDARRKPTDPPPFPSQEPDLGDAPRFPGSDASIWGIPAPSRNFTGRERQLATIGEHLMKGDRITVTQVGAIHGLGGVGKTQLATRYAQQHREHYDLGWWIRAEGPTTFIDDYCRLGVRLGLFPEEQAFDRSAAEAVKDWLEGAGHWLLVFDNVPDPERLEGMIPEARSGHVLITSRGQGDWRQLGAQPLALDVWDRGESIAFLLERTGSEDDEGAGIVAERLGDLPLALEQAACYINRQSIDLREYDSRWQSKGTQLLARGRPLGYEHTVLTTWQVAFSKLAEDHRAAVMVMAICSLMAPEAIPRRLLDGIELEEGESVDDAIESLLSYGLISCAEEMVSVHRLVQEMVRTATLKDHEAGDHIINMAGALLADRFPGDPAQPDEWRVCRQLIPHALALLELVGEEGEPGMKQARLHFHVASWLSTQRNWAGAREHFERSLEIETGHLGEGHLLLVRTHGNLGAALAHEEKYEDARKHLQIALDMEKEIWGEDSIETAVTLSNLGVLMHSAGDVEAGKEALRASLEVLARAPQEGLQPYQKCQFVSSHLNLAVIHRKCGENELWKQEVELARAEAERLFDQPHPMMAKAEAELSGVYRNAGDLDAGRLHLERALDIAEKAWDGDHPEIGARQISLGRFLLYVEESAEARRYLEAAAELLERIHGRGSRELIEPLGLLALACVADGDADAGRERLRTALGLAGGPIQYPGVLISMENLDEELPTLAERVLLDV